MEQDETGGKNRKWQVVVSQVLISAHESKQARRAAAADSAQSFTVRLAAAQLAR